MPRFRVTDNLQHDGKAYAPGSTVEMTHSQAAAIPWAVQPMPVEKAPSTVTTTVEAPVAVPVPASQKSPDKASKK